MSVTNNLKPQHYKLLMITDPKVPLWAIKASEQSEVIIIIAQKSTQRAAVHIVHSSTEGHICAMPQPQ